MYVFSLYSGIEWQCAAGSSFPCVHNSCPNLAALSCLVPTCFGRFNAVVTQFSQVPDGSRFCQGCPVCSRQCVADGGALVVKPSPDAFRQFFWRQRRQDVFCFFFAWRRKLRNIYGLLSWNFSDVAYNCMSKCETKNMINKVKLRSHLWLYSNLARIMVAKVLLYAFVRVIYFSVFAPG